jgi:DNA repair photolyase
LFRNGDTLHQTMWHIPEEYNFPCTFSDENFVCTCYLPCRYCYATDLIPLDLSLQ